MSDNPFWKFALEFYQQPNVERACIAFQDEFGGNVCLLLFCCWLDINNCDVSFDQLTILDKQVQKYEDQYLHQLRNSRRQSRPQLADAENPQHLYALAKRLELQGEKFLCDQFYDWYLQQPVTKTEVPDSTSNYLRKFTVDANLASLIMSSVNKVQRN